MFKLWKGRGRANSSLKKSSKDDIVVFYYWQPLILCEISSFGSTLQYIMCAQLPRIFKVVNIYDRLEGIQWRFVAKLKTYNDILAYFHVFYMHSTIGGNPFLWRKFLMFDSTPKKMKRSLGWFVDSGMFNSRMPIQNFNTHKSRSNVTSLHFTLFTR